MCCALWAYWVLLAPITLPVVYFHMIFLRRWQFRKHCCVYILHVTLSKIYSSPVKLTVSHILYINCLACNYVREGGDNETAELWLISTRAWKLRITFLMVRSGNLNRKHTQFSQIKSRVSFEWSLIHSSWRQTNGAETHQDEWN